MSILSPEEIVKEQLAELLASDEWDHWVSKCWRTLNATLATIGNDQSAEPEKPQMSEGQRVQKAMDLVQRLADMDPVPYTRTVVELRSDSTTLAAFLCRARSILGETTEAKPWENQRCDDCRHWVYAGFHPRTIHGEEAHSQIGNCRAGSVIVQTFWNQPCPGWEAKP